MKPDTKVSTKKIYCPDCQKLVMPREQKTGNDVRVSCSRCQKPLWLWNGIYWKRLEQSAVAEKPKEKRKR
ncbi:MAG: hypothetical protein HYX79_04440 [Chloroflexi bacterium]|nr:hypothetical protein [Chloroflexota bacterium]